jgi:RNA ligase (TIGR02306 family)
MRKMAHIEQIKNILPIEGADNVALAHVLDWEVVVKKNEFNVGDFCIYVEIDSVFPQDNPIFSFMEARKYHVKTARFLGQISQGICFPIDILPEDNRDIELGQDVSEILNIVKYEPVLHASLLGTVKGLFPGFLSKTDEERIQNCGWLCDVYTGIEMYETQKLDGSSMTVYIKDGEFGVCSRNYELKREDDEKLRCAFWKCAEKLELEERLRILGFNVALQGELVGPNIQKNRLGLKDIDFYVYNVYDIDKSEYFSFRNFKNIVELALGLKTVPILNENFILNLNAKELIQRSIGNCVINPGAMREGCVYRPKVDMNIPRFGRFSFKVINPKYLLKHKE